MVVNVDNNSGDTYQFEIKKDTDLDAIEISNGFRTNVLDADNSDKVVNNKDFNLYKVLGSDVTFTRDSTVALSNNVAIGTNNITLMKGTITPKDGITLEDPTVNFTINGVSAT
jgi:hypothetical protein